MSRWGMRGGGREAQLMTNRACNQGCAFCDRRTGRDAPEFVRKEAVQSRLSAIEGATSILITGGEPTMRRDLAHWVSAAKRKVGEEGRVELETNGTLLYEGRAAELRAAGLDGARVHLPAWGPACDAITRDPGGFETTTRGVEALMAANIPIEFSVPLLQSNRDAVVALPHQVAEAGWPRSMVLSLPRKVPAGSVDQPLPLAEAAKCIAQVEVAARRADVRLRLDMATPLAPCLFPYPARVAHLFAFSPGGRTREGFAQRAACSTCVVADRCPGLPSQGSAGIDEEVEPKPIVEDRVRRRLSVVSRVEDQIQRELFQDELARSHGDPTRHVRTVRIGFRCNQGCDFCFVSTHLPKAPREDVRRAVVEAARKGMDINFSGGEPTLDPHLEQWVALARKEGAGRIELQTNATLLNEERALALQKAGVDEVFVSLHGSHAETSDRVTRAPGTFVKTRRGLDAVATTDLNLRVNFVFCESNAHDFPAFIQLVAARWPAAIVCVSFVAASTDMVPKTAALIPRYSDIQQPLQEGVRAAQKLGLRVTGFDSMCGLPLCLAPPEVVDAMALDDVPGGYASDEMTRGEACEGCKARNKCFGVRVGYAALHGTDELRAI